MIYIIVLLIVLKFIPYEYIRQQYIRYKYKRIVKSLLGNVDKDILLRRRQRIYDTFNAVPVVNLYKESIEDAENLLQTPLSLVTFQDDLIDIESVFLRKIFPSDANTTIENCKEWCIIPLTVHYTFKSYNADNFQQEILDVSNRKYFSLDEFIISDAMSFSFVKDLLQKEVVLWGMYYRRMSSTDMIIMLLPFKKQTDDSENYVDIPLTLQLRGN